MKGTTRLSVRMMLTIIAIIIIAALAIWLAASIFGPTMIRLNSGGLEGVLG